MSQLAIDFDTGGTAPFQRHSRTSRRAAEAMEPRAGTKRAQVLGFLRACGSRGATDEEMQRRQGDEQAGGEQPIAGDREIALGKRGAPEEAVAAQGEEQAGQQGQRLDAQGGSPPAPVPEGG